MRVERRFRARVLLSGLVCCLNSTPPRGWHLLVEVNRILEFLDIGSQVFPATDSFQKSDLERLT